MRIAISGSHFTGKTSLVEALQKILRSYEFYEEPYRLMEDEDYEFSEPPSLEDYEMQLKYSIELIEKSSKNAVFDRCPLDLLAYSLVQAENEGENFDQDSFLNEIEASLESIDLLIFLGVEEPDRIPLPRSEDKELRAQVDEKLKEIILENSLGIVRKIQVLHLKGPLLDRMRQVKEHI